MMKASYKWVVFCWLLLCSGLFTNVLASADASKLVADATRLLVSNQIEQAIDLYSQAIKIEPSYTTYYRRGTAFLGQGNSLKALNDFEKVVSLNPKYTEAKLKRNTLLLSLGKVERLHTLILADLSIDSASKYDKETVDEFYRLKGLAEEMMQHTQLSKKFVEAGSYIEALEYLDYVIENCPFDHDSRVLRGTCYNKLGRISDAISDISRSINLKNDNTEGFLLLSELYYQNGNAELSLINIRHCLQLDQDHKKCKAHYKIVKKLNKQLKKAEQLINDSNFESALDALKLCLDQTQGVAAFVQYLNQKMCLCHANSKSGDEDALKTCDVAITYNSADYNTKCNKAEILLDMSKFDEAIQLYQEVLENDQNNHRAREGKDKAEKLKKQASKRDYYKILGVKRTATNKEIVKAYRKKAKEWHPDKYAGDDPEYAEKMFIDLAHAKEVLTDEEMRRQFDQGIDPLDSQAKSQAPNPFQGFHGFNGGGGFHGGFHQGGGHRQHRGGGGRGQHFHWG